APMAIGSSSRFTTNQLTMDSRLSRPVSMARVAFPAITMQESLPLKKQGSSGGVRRLLLRRCLLANRGHTCRQLLRLRLPPAGSLAAAGEEFEQSHFR